RLALVQRLPWIKRQRAQLQAADRQSLREMVTGESHFVWGNRYRLVVNEQPGRAHIELDGSRLRLCVPAGTSTEKRRQLLHRWYRSQLRDSLPVLVAKWEPVIGVGVP